MTHRQTGTDRNSGEASPSLARSGIIRWWVDTPLYLRILGALGLGVATGLILGDSAQPLALLSKAILRLLTALAPGLILLAIVRALAGTRMPRGVAARLAGLLATNTIVAICIGLAVANVLQPGAHSDSTRTLESTSGAAATPIPGSAVLDALPKSLLGPLADGGNVLAVLFIAVAFGMALRPQAQRPVRTVMDLIDAAFDALVTVLRWLVQIIPFAVFGVMASIVGARGFSGLGVLGAYVVTVLVALALQAVFYLLRVRFGSWVRPTDLLRGGRDALLTAFSTASTTATMPVTYACLRERIGVQEKSASLGALVGTNFNNDGTALYEAVSALFIAQLIGLDLSLYQQLVVMFTSVLASIGAAGFPEAGLVSIALVLNAVGLPLEYMGLLLTVDWLLDRCRTSVNVMGDLTVSCLLDGRQRPAGET